MPPSAPATASQSARARSSMRPARGGGDGAASAAARRNARTAWPLASDSSSSVAYSARADAISSLEGGVGTAPMWGLSPMSPGLASSCLVDRLLGDLRQLLVRRRLLVEGLAEEL